MNAKTYAVIHFADRGQSFASWEVGKDGAVLATAPEGDATWTRYHVTNLPDLKPGALVQIRSGAGLSQIAAPVERVVTPFNHYTARRGR